VSALGLAFAAVECWAAGTLLLFYFLVLQRWGWRYGAWYYGLPDPGPGPRVRPAPRSFFLSGAAAVLVLVAVTFGLMGIPADYVLAYLGGAEVIAAVVMETERRRNLAAEPVRPGDPPGPVN
jgi:hypothetical protein